MPVKTRWMPPVVIFQSLLPYLPNLLPGPVMDLRRSEQVNPRVLMLPVVPRHIFRQIGAGVFEGGEDLRVPRTILHGAESGLTEGLVVGHIRPVMA